MHGRKIDAHRALAVLVVASVLGAAFVASHSGSGAPASRVFGQVEPQRVSEALAATEQKTPQPSPAAASTPTLRETLLAADQLVRSGALPAPTPTLKQVLESADALVKAGVLAAPTPTLEQTLQAADQLVRAGVIPPPEPTLEQVLIAADKIRIASLVPEPTAAPAPQPTLQEILLAADAIRIADEAQRQAAAPPPPAPPPAPIPTSTPIPAPPPPPAAAPKQSGGSGFWDANFAGQVLALVNQRRAAAGLGPVAVESRLEQSARDYAKVLADSNTFSHTGSDGSTLVSRVTATGFPFDVQIGEVLAWGSDHWQPAEIVQAWMDSPGHKEQLLGPYTRAGAGCYFTDAGSTVRCVIDFAG